MALDGSTLHIIAQNLKSAATGSRIEKITMPYKDQIILHLSSRDFSGRLLISCNPTSPRIHLTNQKFENPATPPMLCMLLRKRFSGGRLIDVRQAGFDRILFLDFDCKNELGDNVMLTVCVEIMGRMSNIIFLQDNKIIDCVRRFDPEEGKRFVLPGAEYELPPAQDKIGINADFQLIQNKLKGGNDLPLDKALMSAIDGVSPILCREISTLACKGFPLISEMSDKDFDRLRFYVNQTAETLQKGGTPTMVLDKTNKPKDFTFINVTQYSTAAITRQYDDFHLLLDEFYAQRDNGERMRQQSADLLKLLTNLSERTARKIQHRKTELKAVQNREQLREFGELIKANLHLINAGDSSFDAVNYYDPDCKTVRIPLDIALSPSKNAQKYFKEYRKAATAAGMLDELIKQAEDELVYIDSVFDSLTRATTQAELTEIRAELIESGYLKSADKKVKNKASSQPMKYISDDGFVILVGKNNKQNDTLTLKTAAKNDIWLHTKNIPGSHVVIISDGNQIPDSTIEQAAILAATNSKAAASKQVPVEYTFIKNVKKPAGAKPGMVIYVNNKTAFVDPDPQLADRLKA
ncbi:MAG: NFACT family protein [Clostridia bacterium]|nr:NFACT family protein [Clostridia bacterium]